MTPTCTPLQYRGADAVQLQGEGMGTVVILLHGGHVASWQDPSGTERLYLSPLSSLSGPAAVRGGVPIVFPQFSLRGPIVRHGIARTQPWRIQAPQHSATDASTASTTLELTDTAATRAMWPHAFACELRVELKPWQLDLTLTVRNTAEAPWSFAAALHTYLAVPDLDSTELHGLHGQTYEDALLSGALQEETDPVLRPRGPIDRIYFDAHQRLTLNSASMRMTLDQNGWRDTVVWNPGVQGAQAIADLPDTDHDQFLCVEAAAIREAITLQPGEDWSGTQSLRVDPPASASRSVV